MLINIQFLISPKNKTSIDFLHEICLGEKIPILALTETWLHHGIEDAEISIPGYCVIRSDRVSSTKPDFPHGGVAMYVREDLIISDITRFSNGVVDGLCLHLTQLKMTCLLIYRPP